MTTGYKTALSGGLDLSSLFDPIHAGWPAAAATGYLVGGADLNTLFAAVSSGTSGSNDNYRNGGTDLNLVFAGVGSTTVQVSAPGTFTYSGLGASGTTNSVTATATKGKQSGYTFSWTVFSSTGGVVVINSPTAATTTITVSQINGGATITGVIHVTASDGTSTSAIASVNFSAHNTFSGGTTVFIVGNTAGGATKSGTITFPAGANIVQIVTRGGGGGGGVGSVSTGGGGGGQGGEADVSATIGQGPLTGTTSFTYSITAGGASTIAQNTAGGTGGTTHVTAGTVVLNATGGGGGAGTVGTGGTAGIGTETNGSHIANGAAGTHGSSTSGGNGGGGNGAGDTGFGANGNQATPANYNTTCVGFSSQSGNGGGAGGDIFNSGFDGGGEGAVGFVSYLFQ